MDQVVLVQEDTEDQVQVVVAPAVAVVPVEVAAEQDAEPDTDLAEAGNVPVAVEQQEVPAEAVQAVLASSQEDNPVEVPVEEWPVEEDPAEVESLAAEQVQTVMMPEVHQEVRMMEKKSELIVPERNMLNSRSEREQQEVEERVERQRKLNHCHTELFPHLHLPSSKFARQERLRWQQKWPPAKLGQSMMHQVQEKMNWRSRIDRERFMRLFR